MRDDRAVSSVLGVVLILGITVAAVTSVMVIGTMALQQSQDDADLSRMETSMAQMSSKASLAALGDADMQRFDLGDTGNGELTVDPDAGSIMIVMTNESGEEVANYSRPLGSLIYEYGEDQVAYQGGGVWRSSDDDGGHMISPPEYHYRAETLTFPIVQISGEETSSGAGSGVVEYGSGNVLYPQGDLDNPVDANVTVTVNSEYYRGWYDFFDSRTTGNVSYDSDNGTATMELDIPFDERIQYPISTQELSGHSGPVDEETASEGGNRQSASTYVENTIEQCDGPNFGDNDEYTNEMYCASHDVEISEQQIEFSENETIRVAVDGDIDFDNTEISIEEGTNVEFYVRGSVVGGDDINADGSADQLIFYLHSDGGDIWNEDASYNDHMKGIIYAPGSEISFDGSAEFSGAVIADTVDIGGNAVTIEEDQSVFDVDLDLPDELDEIRYLHITNNIIEVQLD